MLHSLSQVDVIFSARGEVLQNQLAYCYRLLGALQNSQKLVEKLDEYKKEIKFGSNDFGG